MGADLVKIALLLAQVWGELEKCDDDELYALLRSGIISQQMIDTVKSDAKPH